MLNPLRSVPVCLRVSLVVFALARPVGQSALDPTEYLRVVSKSGTTIKVMRGCDQWGLRCTGRGSWHMRGTLLVPSDRPDVFILR